MSSPKRRIETDVMKLMMSDYEVTLVNDNMQEFFVIFKGPTESKPCFSLRIGRRQTDRCAYSTLRRRQVESPRRTPRRISVQLALNRLR